MLCWILPFAQHDWWRVMAKPHLCACNSWLQSYAHCAIYGKCGKRERKTRAMEESLYLCKWSDRTIKRHDIPIPVPDTKYYSVHDAELVKPLIWITKCEVWIWEWGETIFVVKSGTHIRDALSYRPKWICDVVWISVYTVTVFVWFVVPCSMANVHFSDLDDVGFITEND